jgi:hypothetical protein
MNSIHRSILTRALMTTGLSVALMTASAAGVHAEDVTIQGAPGAKGADGVFPGDNSQPGGVGESVTANAGSSDPLNKAMAIGGGGGAGGSGSGSPGGNGGDAAAIASGSAEADAISVGGMGGQGGGQSPTGNSGQDSLPGGPGGSATANAFAGSTGNATATATATAGSGGFTFGQGPDSPGANASASSTASATGSGDALSSAIATGGNTGDGGAGEPALAGGATATAVAFANGSGKAIAKAAATPAFSGSFSLPFPVANATSNAETARGGMAQALSTVGSFQNTVQPIALQSTAATSFEGVSVRSNAVDMAGLDTAAEAIAQGGSSQTFAPPGGTFFNGNTVFAAATALPDKAYATTLIGGARNVADALLGPGDKIFGTAIVDSLGGFAVGVPSVLSASSTFDFSFQGDLLFGEISPSVGGVVIIINGTEMDFNTSSDTVINLGNFGPNIDLTIYGFGTFAFGGAVPEPSTWAMMLIGFAGLGYAGHRGARVAQAA